MKPNDCDTALLTQAIAEGSKPAKKDKASKAIHEPVDLMSYDVVLIAMSGGKDSVACLIEMLEAGVPKERIELWHHDVDGREGSTLMDWPVTRSYNEALARAFGLPIYFSWREGGIEREMLRKDARTAPTLFETPDGLKKAGGIRGKESTRQRFPQQSADLSVRWCSSSAKIDVCSIAINNQPRFIGKRVLLVSGERAEESSARAGYNKLEVHRSSTKKRTVHQLRPVHGFTEAQVWDSLRRWMVNPHPAYHLGWGRMSCMKCIFGNAAQWASVNVIHPRGVIQIAQYETQFNSTLRRDGPIMDTVAKGVPHQMKPEDIKTAMSEVYDREIFVTEWKLPSGAFTDSAGPT